MYVGYGTYGGSPWYAHQPGEAGITFTVEQERSKWRGRRYARRHKMVVYGALSCNHETKTLSEQIDEFIAAYAVDGLTLALYDDSNNMTQHALDATDSGLIEGPFIKVRSWPKGDNGEYASKRSYVIEGEALYYDFEDTDPWAGIIKYQESFQYYGNGGPERRWVYDQSSQQWEYDIIPSTRVRLIQQGHSIGYSGYALPLNPVEPVFLVNKQVYRNPISPTFATGGTKEYHYHWSFPMDLPAAYGTMPHYPVSR